MRPDHRLEESKNKYANIVFADGKGLISEDYDWTQRSGLSAEGMPQFGTFLLKPFSVTMLNDQDRFFTRMIAPSGLTISETGTLPTSMLNSFVGGIRSPGRTPMNGVWTFQTVVNDVVDASHSFRVVNGFDRYTVDRLEFSLVAEQSAAGEFSVRIENLTDIGLERVSSLLNDRVVSTAFNNAGAAFAKFTPEKNQQSIFSVWIKTNQKRYSFDPSKGFGGNEGDTYNVIRQVKVFTDANGKLLDNRFEFDETGTNYGYFAEANIQSAQTGRANVYVVVFFNNEIFFRGKTGWTKTPAEIVSFNGPAAVNVNLLTAFDLSLIPAGANLYVGYGNSIDQMIARSQFKLLKVF